LSEVAVGEVGTYLNLILASFSKIAGKKWLVEPSVAPTVICPGRALASSINSLTVFHLVLGLAVNMEGVEATRQIGSKSQ
jgi:hypothetical protein